MTGQDLREIRLHAGLTQRQLAERLDVPQSTIARWETGAIAIQHPLMLRGAVEHLSCARKRSKRR